MISVGAAIDAGLVTAWNVGVGRKNERVAMAGLWAMAAFRTYLAIHNLRNTRNGGAADHSAGSRQPRRFSELRSACERATMRGCRSNGSLRIVAVGDSSRSCNPPSSR